MSIAQTVLLDKFRLRDYNNSVEVAEVFCFQPKCRYPGKPLASTTGKQGGGTLRLGQGLGTMLRESCGVKVCGVYEIINSINGKRYIGSSQDVYRRWSTHKSRLRRQVHSNPYLQNAWNKYGYKSFTFRLILICEVNEVLRYEQCFINLGVYEYNISIYASAPTRGRKQSERTKAKRQKSRSGYRHSEETKKRISNSLMGHGVSQEARDKLRKANTGKKGANLGRSLTDEQKLHLSKINKGKNHPSWIDLPVNEMRAFRQQGYSYAKIGELYGVCFMTARDRILGLSENK